MPNNQKIYELANEALSGRIDWEKKMSRYELQRYCQDRARVMNNPWPKSSNIRYPLSDMIIDQWKPFLYKIIFSSEQLAYFKGLNSKLARFNAHVASYFDWVVKEKTNFETEIQYCADAALQDGETLVKVIWDADAQVPYFMLIDNLFLITPTTTTNLDEAPWLIHVIHASKNALQKRFKDVEGIDKLVEEIDDNSNADQESTVNREQDRYTRVGINQSTNSGQIVLWEFHYKDEETGLMRLKTMTPLDVDFDFQDDREYPYEYCIKEKKWMIRHFKRELTQKSMHSARGFPELVQEGEHSLSAMWRSKHNAMAIYNNPALYAPNGISGSTQNYSLIPGQIFPFELRPLELGQPPISWDQEMMVTREIFERRAQTPDFGIGNSNTQTDSRTKFEVQQISNLQSLGVELQSGNWKKFNREIFRMAWGYMVQYLKENQNASLTYFLKSEATEIPVEAIDYEYEISCSGSAESVNKEYMVQKAQAMFQQSLQLNDPAVVHECWKNFVERLEPGQVERFSPDPMVRQQKAQNKTASDLATMMTTLMPVHPEPGDDLYTQALTAMQFIQAQQQLGLHLIPPQIQRIVGYISENREALQKTDKNQYMQLMQQFNAIDLASRQQAAQQMTQTSGHPMPQAPQAPQAPQIPQGQPPQMPQQPGAMMPQSA